MNSFLQAEFWSENSINNHAAYRYLENIFNFFPSSHPFSHSCEKLMEKLHTHNLNMIENLLHKK